MNHATRDILGRLEAADLFSRVGCEDFPNVAYVSSWLEAAGSFADSQWDNVRNEALNVLGYQVQIKSEQRYNEWNSHSGEMRPLVRAMAVRKTAPILKACSLPDRFATSVFSDLLVVTMETEYVDVAEPGVFSTLIAACYERGHFPCGWEGKFPSGKLVVY